MMLTIHNQELSVRIDSIGAEICSVKDAQGTEYLWQKDEKIWDEQAPNLFPYIGRMTGKHYQFEGRSYPMGIHGFVRGRELSVEDLAEDSVTFRLESSEETESMYPFVFTYLVQYRLEGNKIHVDYEVVNRDKKCMYFGIGGHPGFCLPNRPDAEFEDYYLEFEDAIEPMRIGFSEDCFVSGEKKPFHLEEGRYLPLRHELFDQDAVVLENSGSSVVLKCTKGGVAIRVKYPDMRYLGFWHAPGTAAGYVCLEPWSSLPSRKDVVEDLAAQEDLISLEPGRTYGNHWSIELTRD